MDNRIVSISTVFGDETSTQVPLAGSRDLWVVSEDPTLAVLSFCVSKTAYLSCEHPQNTGFPLVLINKEGREGWVPILEPNVYIRLQGINMLSGSNTLNKVTIFLSQTRYIA